MKFNPLHDRIVIKRNTAESKSEGGLHIPDSAKDKPARGVVEAVGLGKHDDNGARMVPDVVVGDEVIFGKYAGTELNVDGSEFMVVREEDILVQVVDGKLRPMLDRVVVQRDETEQKIGTIWVPDTAKEKPARGTVVSVGPGRRDDTGARIEPDLKAGDQVMFGKYAGNEIELKGVKLVVLREDEILTVFAKV